MLSDVTIHSMQSERTFGDCVQSAIQSQCSFAPYLSKEKDADNLFQTILLSISLITRHKGLKICEDTEVTASYLTLHIYINSLQQCPQTLHLINFFMKLQIVH